MTKCHEKLHQWLWELKKMCINACMKLTSDDVNSSVWPYHTVCGQVISHPVITRKTHGNVALWSPLHNATLPLILKLSFSFYLHLKIELQFVRFVGQDDSAGPLLDTPTRYPEAGLDSITAIKDRVLGVCQSSICHNLSPRRLSARSGGGQGGGGAAIYRGVCYFLLKLN